VFTLASYQTGERRHEPVMNINICGFPDLRRSAKEKKCKK
jgi:hypothetical protein